MVERMIVNQENIETVDFLAGAVFLIDKPLEWTSFDVVNKLRFKLKYHLNVKKIKVGHAGTLDPLATGLLIICCGKETKNIESYQGLFKGYEGQMKLGETTPSFDAETAVDKSFDISTIDWAQLENNLAQFRGEISQFPPMFSAVKVGGKVAYKSARKGETLALRERQVVIDQFDLSNFNAPFVDFKIQCSKGTYIRSLVNDFGKALKNGAYMTKLRRTYIGDFHIEDAWNLEDLVQSIEALD